MAATVRASRSALGGPEFAPGPHGPLQRLLEVAPMVNGVDVIPTTPTVLRDPQGESGCKRNTAGWAFDRAKCKAPRHQEPRHSQHNQQASDRHPDDYQS